MSRSRKNSMVLTPRNACLFSLTLLFALLLHAQSTGSIRGTVADASGASIPGASVTVTGTATGLTRTEQSNSSGLFVFPDLPIGPYTVTISKSGFATQKRAAAELLTGQTIGLDVALSVGLQTESVDVSADTQQVQTATSEVSTSVDEKQIQDLPLNARNPLQLTQLTPGAALTTVGTEVGQQDNVGLTVNGLRATENNYQLDGAMYINRFFDSVPVLPNPDALQEFTIQSADYSAQYAGAGALVQLSTRSGTDQLHGTAYEFIRNTVLNSHNYFQSVVPPFKLNQFGGPVGGPVVIPHVYNGRDKTFFFFSAEDLQQRSSPNPINITVPTAAQLAGDFSALLHPASGLPTVIYNPATGLPYPGNIITSGGSSLSQAVAQAFLTPLHANQTTGVFVSTSNSNIDLTQYLVKLDHSISENNHLSGRYFYVQDNFQRAFNAPLGFYAANRFRNQSLTLSDTQVFSNSLTATFYAGAGRFARTQVPVSPGLRNLQSLGQNLPYGTADVPVFPGVRANISGFVNIFSGGGLTQDPTSFEYKAQAIKVVRANAFSFGATFERDRVDATDYSYTPGDNTFNGQRTAAPAGAPVVPGFSSPSQYKTGYAPADFFLGLDSTFFQDNGRKVYLREDRVGLYLQDDYKASRSLILNAGLRWDPWLPPNDLNQTLVGFLAGRQSLVAPNAPRGLVFRGDPGVQASIFPRNLNDFAPRIGFAYSVAGQGRTVVRGAYGLFYNFPEALLYQRTDAAQPVNLYLQINNPPQWDNIYAGYPGGDPFPRPHLTPAQFGSYPFLLPFSGGVLNPLSKVSYTQDYNLTVEQQMPGRFAMSLAYVGNHALHIMSSRQFNPAVYEPGATVANENARRLYPGLGSVALADSYEYAVYNSLQLNVTRRVANGLTLLSNITFSKTIDNGSDATELATGPPNPFNLNSSRGPADFDQTIRFNAAVDYITPRYRGNRFAQPFLNGYQLNVIANLYTGLPFTVLSGTDRSLSGVGNDYADVVPGISTRRPAGANRVSEYFNRAAFAAAAPGTFGDSSRNSLRGPGFEEIDASLFKDFFTERRIHGQFRAEGFNMLNHPNLANPVSTFSAGNFGQITGTVATSASNLGPRVFQFGAKVIF